MKRIMLLYSGLLLLAPAFAHTPAKRAQHAEAVVPSAPASETSGGSVLVAYFTCPETAEVDASSGASRIVDGGKEYGNTEYVARLIAEATGGDLHRIETLRTYPAAHRALIDEAKREAEAGERPALKSRIASPDDYQVIYVGFPNWWYDMPMALYTFFEQYDFAGKTVIPFCTHGGSRFSQTVETISALEPEARVLRGPALSRNNLDRARETVAEWLARQQPEKSAR